MFTPTAPVEPVAKILMLPAPSEMKMLQFWVPKPLAEADPKITLQAPDVMQAPELCPMAVFSVPVTRYSDWYPKAVFLFPVVLQTKALRPTDVLPCPVVIINEDESPIAVLYLPVVLLRNEFRPTAVFLVPVVLLLKVQKPTAVLPLALLLNNAWYPTPTLLEPP